MKEADNYTGIASLICSALSERADLAAVYLFGSVAESRAHMLSDIDVAILFREEVSEELIAARVLEIGRTLEDTLRRPVDVVVLNWAPTVLCFQVIQHGRLLLEKDPAQRGLFVMRILGRYYDMKPYLDYHQAQLVARIREKGLGRGYQGHRDALAEARQLSAQLASTAKDIAG